MARFDLLVRMSLFPRLVLVGCSLAALGGGIWGLVRGLSYLPTLVVAVVEGAILVSVFVDPVVVVLAGVVTLLTVVRRRLSGRPSPV